MRSQPDLLPLSAHYGLRLWIPIASLHPFSVCPVRFVVGQVWRTSAHKHTERGESGSEAQRRIGVVPGWVAEESPKEHLGLLGPRGRSAKQEKSGLELLGLEGLYVHGWGNGLVPDAPTRRD